MNLPQTMIASHSSVETTAKIFAGQGRDAAASHSGALRRTAVAYRAVIVATTMIIAILAQNIGVTNCRTGSATVWTRPVNSSTARPRHIQGTTVLLSCEMLRPDRPTPNSRKLTMQAEPKTIDTARMWIDCDVGTTHELSWRVLLRGVSASQSAKGRNMWTSVRKRCPGDCAVP